MHARACSKHSVLGEWAEVRAHDLHLPRNLQADHKQLGRVPWRLVADCLSHPSLPEAGTGAETGRERRGDRRRRHRRLRRARDCHSRLVRHSLQAHPAEDTGGHSRTCSRHQAITNWKQGVKETRGRRLAAPGAVLCVVIPRARPRARGRPEAWRGAAGPRSRVSSVSTLCFLSSAPDTALVPG